MKTLIAMALVVSMNNGSALLPASEVTFVNENPIVMQQDIEYPAATFVYHYLRESGYSAPVASGILGNIMVEVGGNTLEVDEQLENYYYYGMCQWSKEYYPEVRGTSLKEQCIYLVDTIENEFRNFGWIYEEGFDYNKFLLLSNPEDAALAFAKVYERCAKGSYNKRQECAGIAYEYFMSSAIMV